MITNHKRYLKWNCEDLEKVKEELQKAEQGLYPAIVYVALSNYKDSLEERVKYRKEQIKKEEEEN